MGRSNFWNISDSIRKFWKEGFLWNRDTVKWKIKSWACASRIVLTEELEVKVITQAYHRCGFGGWIPSCLRLWGLEGKAPSCWAIFGKKCFFNAIWITSDMFLEPFKRTKLLRFGSHLKNYIAQPLLTVGGLIISRQQKLCCAGQKMACNLPQF